MSSLLLTILLALLGCVIPFTPDHMDFALDGPQANALLCRPDGNGPFPAVVYSHGLGARAGAGELIGRPLCQRLAADGFLAFVPTRDFYSRYGRENIRRNLGELSLAVDYVKSLANVDPTRVAVMGHSRGGLLTLMVGLERKDLKALIITAPASIPPYFPRAVASVSQIRAPVLLMVEVSDERGSLGAVNILDEALKKQGKDLRTIRYDRGGGHFLFVGSGDLYWWNDVWDFLREKLL